MDAAWIIAALALLTAGLLAWLLGHAQARASRLERDITAVKEALSVRIDRAIQLRDSLLRAIDDPLLVLDAEQNILFHNPAAEALAGPNLSGKSLLEAIRQPELESLIDDARRVRGEGVARHIELNNRIYQASATVFEDATSTFEILVMRDVTEVQRLERARREMVSNVSHELSTPITAIGLLADTLVNMSTKRKSKKARKMAADIRREADTLTQLVQEMRDLSLIESGQMLVRLMPTDLEAIVSAAVDPLLPLAENKEQELSIFVPEGVRVLADEVQVQRAIKNLVHNAIKFSPPGGKINVSATVSDQEAKIAIKDTGPGIAPDQQARIFERFYQVDRARRGGTGLGLAIVRHIVLAHGGRVWVESQEGFGATFYIALALADELPSLSADKVQSITRPADGAGDNAAHAAGVSPASDSLPLTPAPLSPSNGTPPTAVPQN